MFCHVFRSIFPCSNLITKDRGSSTELNRINLRPQNMYLWKCFFFDILAFIESTSKLTQNANFWEFYKILVSLAQLSNVVA